VLRRFCSPRWLAFHLLVLVLVATFCALGWWQVRRAGEGNALSFGYALEWPAFAAFTVFVWYRTLRDTVRPPAAEQPAAPPAYAMPVLPAHPAPPAVPEDEDPELAAYNRYLAALAETDRQT
jgi:DNA-binding transcriptional regulator of glucitol operon